MLVEKHTDLSIIALNCGGQAIDEIGGVFALDKTGALNRSSNDAHKGAGQGQDREECGAHVDGLGCLREECESRWKFEECLGVSWIALKC